MDNAKEFPEAQEQESEKEFRGVRKGKKNIFFTVFQKGTIDWPMFIIIMLLVSVGSVMVFSASYAYALSSTGNSRYYINQQIRFVALGTVVMMVIAFMRYHIFKRFAPLIYAAAVGLLLLVLVVGSNAGEAKRWIIIGPVSMQPSEVMKFALIIILAWYFDRNYRKVNIKGHFWRSTFYGIVIPMLFVGFACALILAENHLSGTIIVFLIGLSVIWEGGGKWQWFLVFGVLAVVGLVVFLNFTEEITSLFPPYVQRRVDLWQHPENYSVQGEAWQTVQGKIAVGSGGLLGRGLGNSLQKHLFVSQPQNDFIFAIVCEEFGFVGAVGVILLYLVFIWRGLHIAKRAPDVFGAITAFGIVAHVAIQALLNMAVVTGIIPNTGITLPFFSYGGSSLIILMAEMGVLLSISKYSKIQK